MALLLRRERDRGRIGALLEVSQASIGGAYVGLLLLLVGGIWAGIYANHFARGWIWAAIAVLVVVLVAMYAIATPYFGRLRTAVGGSSNRGDRNAPVIPAPDAEGAALAARAPVAPPPVVGSGGPLVVLWGVVLKPF